MEKARRVSRTRLLRLFDNMPKVVQQHRGKTREKQLDAVRRSQQLIQDNLAKPSTYWLITIRNSVLKALPSVSIIVGGSSIMNMLTGSPHWSWSDSIYYGLITGSTIGYGDFSPHTRAARLFAIFYIPLAVASAGEILSGVATALVDRRQREVYAQQLERNLTIHHLKAMDADGDGRITREEYVQFMLIEMGKISTKELDELHTQFERLDVTRSGYLDNEDLKLMAELQGVEVKD